MMKFISTLIIAVAVYAMPLQDKIGGGIGAFAADQLAQGAKVGAALPHPLTMPDQNNKRRDFQSLSGKKGLILLFTRSLDW